MLSKDKKSHEPQPQNLRQASKLEQKKQGKKCGNDAQHHCSSASLVGVCADASALDGLALGTLWAATLAWVADEGAVGGAGGALGLKHALWLSGGAGGNVGGAWLGHAA